MDTNTKTLKVTDIPEGYKYAAVDMEGFAYAYKVKPVIFKNEHEGIFAVDKVGDCAFIGHGFDATDWEESLISK